MARYFYNKWPLWLQITALFLVLCGLLIVSTGEYLRHKEHSFLLTSIEKHKKRLIDTVASSAIESVITEDIPVLKTIVEQITAANSDIASLIIENEERKILASWISNAEIDKQFWLSHSEPIKLEGETFGYIEINWNLQHKITEINKHIFRTYLFNSLALLLITVIGILAFNWLVTRPIKDIVNRLLGHASGEALQAQKLETSREFKDLYAAVDTIQSLTISRDKLQNEVKQRKVAQEQLSVARDIAESATEAKSAFLANMSHEIRTPLTAIIGFSESLLDSSMSMSDRVESIQAVIRSGRHLQNLINDILDLSKIEAGKLELDLQETDIFTILHDVHALARIQADEKGLTCDLDCHFPLPEKIIADPLRLKQILINLCGNAVKFTKKGNIRIDVRYPKDESKLIIKIIDSGIGMTEGQLNKIFNPFTQADSSTTRSFGGTGLGLHLSQLFAEKMNASITVDSTLDVGSVFTLSINTGELDSSELLTETPEMIVATQEELPTLTGNVLLAEDNIDNQRLISILLHRLGADVSIANNGEEAIEMATNKSFDLILMDMQMPVMNGIDATQQLRKNNYKGVIAALTANATTEDMEMCLNNGFDLFLTKPINRKEFYETVSKFLKNIDTPTEEDTSPILSNMLDDPDIAHLIPDYLKRLPEIINEITHAFEENDFKEMRRFTHNLKSTSGSYGFIELYQEASKLEFEITKKDKTGILHCLKNINSLANRICIN